MAFGWPWCGRVCPDVEVGFVPAALEVVEESEFDFGCDVGVDLGNAIREMVPEASCLGDLRCAASDQPGLVTVPQSVEGQAGADRNRAGAGSRAAFVAVDRGFEYAADESASPQPGSAFGGEHELVVVPFEMLAQHGDEERWQGDRAG